MISSVDLGGTIIERHADTIITTFPTGEICTNQIGNGSQNETAAWLGLNLSDYVFQHEICHILVPLVLFGERGYVSWMAANGRKMSLAAAKAEERLIWLVQAAVAGKIAVPHGCEDAVVALRSIQDGENATINGFICGGCGEAFRFGDHGFAHTMAMARFGKDIMNEGNHAVVCDACYRVLAPSEVREH